MHPNPAFRTTQADRTLAFVRDRSFGTLAVNGVEGPMLAHVPFLMSDCGTFAELHLVRSNPITRALAAPLAAVIAVTGPDSYISPDWYSLDHQVPTWNYVSAHLRGTLTLLPQTALRDLLDRQSASFEARLLPKTPWLTDKMPADAMDQMMRQIVPVRLDITRIDSTWKLSQNKPDSARLGAAEGVRQAGFGSETDSIAALMTELPPTDTKG